MTHLGHLGRTAGVGAGLGQGSLGALHWGHLGSMAKPGTGSGKGMGVCCARSTFVGQWELKQVWTRGSQGMLHLGHLRWTAGAGIGMVCQSQGCLGQTVGAGTGSGLGVPGHLVPGPPL